MNTDKDKDRSTNRASTLLLVILYVGVVLRLFYSLTTDPAVRSYDYGGHLAYLRHVQSEWQVPAFDEGWQMYQPPLYYFTASGWSSLFGWGEEARILDVGLVKLFSLCLVVLALGDEIAAGRVLFEKRTGAMVLYCGAIAVWPTLVFFSARISNDVMAYFWGSQAILLLYLWWKRPGWTWWGLLSLAIALGILTKSTCLLLLGIALLVLLLNPRLTLRTRLLKAATALLVAAAVNANVVAQRHSEGQNDLVGNIDRNSPGLYAEMDLGSPLVFNPVAVVRIPFNNPWRDEARRNRFWEYFYRATLFGEFQYENVRPLGSLIVLLGMLTLPAAVFGALRLWRSQEDLWIPVFTVLWASVAALAFMFFWYGIPGFADLRYTPWIVGAYWYFVAFGISELTGRVFRVCLGLYVIFCLALAGLLVYLMNAPN